VCFFSTTLEVTDERYFSIWAISSEKVREISALIEMKNGLFSARAFFTSIALFIVFATVFFLFTAGVHLNKRGIIF